MSTRSVWWAGLLSAALPKAVADDVIGDMVEAGQGNDQPVTLILCLETLWYLAPVALRHLTGPSPALPIAGALAGATLAVAALGAFWRYVLFLVPLRAEHAPEPGTAATGLLLILWCAALGFFTARVLASAGTSSPPSPRQRSHP